MPFRGVHKTPAHRIAVEPAAGKEGKIPGESLTATGCEARDSATENIPPQCIVRHVVVRAKSCGKSARGQAAMPAVVNPLRCKSKSFVFGSNCPNATGSSQ